MPIEIITGGKTRQESVFNGLIKSKKYKIENVLIHDAARPLVSINLIRNIVKKIQKDCVVPMIDINDSIRKFKGTVYQNIQRENIKIIQTPQAFKYKKFECSFKISK